MSFSLAFFKLVCALAAGGLAALALVPQDGVSRGFFRFGAGLYAALLSTADYEKLDFLAKLRTSLRGDAVKLVRHDITWDGKDFQVSVKRFELPAQKPEIAL